MQTMGIYEIRNIKNDMIYIGSSSNLEVRQRDHRNELIRDGHCNNYLQHAWNKYGKESFEFNVLEIIKCRDDLLDIEQKWLDKTKCYKRDVGYNIARFTDTNLRRLEDEDILLIAKLYKDDVHYKEIADIVGVSVATVHAIKNGNIYRDITGLNKLHYKPNKLGKDEVLEIVDTHNNMTRNNIPMIDIMNDLSIEFEVSKDTIFDIVTGKTWSDVTGIEYLPKRTNATKELINRLYSELKQGVSREVLADKYNFTTKYIRRIELGEIWSNVTGVKHKRQRLTEREVIDIYTRKLSGESSKELAREFEVSRPTIDRIKNKKTWKEVTDKIG